MGEENKELRCVSRESLATDGRRKRNSGDNGGDYLAQPKTGRAEGSGKFVNPVRARLRAVTFARLVSTAFALRLAQNWSKHILFQEFGHHGSNEPSANSLRVKLTAGSLGPDTPP